MKVHVTAHQHFLCIEALEPEVPLEGWVPIGPGKIGCVIIDTKLHLGISMEAFQLIKKMKPGHDDLGDIDWFACADGKKAFGWIGGFKRIVNAETSDLGHNSSVFPTDCQTIKNLVPPAALEAMKARPSYKEKP